MSAPVLLFWSFVLGQNLLVTSAQECPAPAAIDARVREILGLGANDVLDERATVDRDGSSLRVTMRGKDNRVLGDRVLRADGSCSELAGVVAVVLSAWLSDVHPEFVASLPESPRQPSPTRTPGPPAETSAPIPASREGALGAAFGVGLSADAPAILGSLGIRWMPVTSGLGAAAAVTLMAPRTQDLSAGSVRYWRWPLVIGPAYRVPLASAKWDLQAGAALAWLHVEGRGFATQSTDNAFLGGGFVSTRISTGSDGFVPFAEVTGVLWRSAEAFVQRSAAQSAVGLPSLELYLAVGGSFRAW